MYLENILHDAFLLGIIFSLSSLVGLIFDFFAGDKFRTKNFRFFLYITLLASIVLPIVYMVFPSHVVTAVIGLALWGIYYETIGFTLFNYIKENTHKADYSKVWGILSANSSLAYLIGPAIATFALTINIILSYEVSLAIFLLASVCGLAFLFKCEKVKVEKPSIVKPGIKAELKIWKILLKHIWPLWIFTVALVMTDAFFWTVGIVFAEQIKNTNALGAAFMSAYMFPHMVMGLLAGRISPKFGKKKTAFISGTLAGLFLILVSFSTSIYMMLFFVILAATFRAIAAPALFATYEEYITRLKGFGNDMIGLEQSSASIGYIFGPILSGYFASIMGRHGSFAAVGIFLASISIASYTVVPRKIRMPNKELESVDEDEVISIHSHRNRSFTKHTIIS